MECPLCDNIESKTFAANGTKYHCCPDCGLILTDSENLLGSDEEKKRYSFHQNTIDDSGYVAFLNRVIEPTLELLPQNASGLDYGCGPNPVLAKIVENNGFKCEYYDPFFFPRQFDGEKYDFVFATECFEHFFQPQNELRRISNLLKQHGLLSIMTEIHNESTDFQQWYYKNDPTHVCFYSEKSFDYICKTFNFRKIYTDNKRVFILEKI